ncbi:MAG TPA: hypothetical protein VFP49_10725 [Nitrososphaeraceae archaeon]|nr:hypothetical protein [Nitrososphaeraceae archaeon]
MKNSVIIIPSSVITAIVYALLATIFLELDNASGEEDININDADSNSKASAPELVDASCKSPCPPTAEMCIQMCA